MGGRNGRKKRPELAAQLHSEAWHCTRAPHLSMERDTDGSLGSAGGWCINSRASRPRTRPDADAPIHRCLRDKRWSQAAPRPSPNAPERHPIGKICGAEQKPPAGGSGVAALRRRPATTACDSDGAAAGCPAASEISRDSGACMHRARFWRPGAAGSRVEY